MCHVSAEKVLLLSNVSKKMLKFESRMLIAFYVVLSTVKSWQSSINVYLFINTFH